MIDMERDAPPPFMLPGRVQPVLACCVVMGLAGIAGWLAWTASRSGPADHDAPPRLSVRFTVNINTAAAAELAALPGIGPTTAARIVERRGAHGPFDSLDQLLDIPGIGEATLDRLRPHLRPIRAAATEDGP